MTLRKDTLSAQEGRSALSLDTMGIGVSAVPVLASLDWQQADFLAGVRYLVSSSNWTNAPTGVSYTSGTGVSIIVESASANGTRQSLLVVPDTTSDANFRIFRLTCVGAKGSRTFSIRRMWDSSSVIPIECGGTGGNTKETARSELGLGNSAVLNVGTTENTVAAGNDSRIVNAASKKGSSYTGVIDFLDNSTSGDPGEAIICRAAHGLVIGGSEYTNNALKIFSNDGSYTRFQHRTAALHAARLVVVTSGAIGTFEFFQTGNAIANGSWLNSGSDERIKDDITPISNPREVLMGIRSATWKYRQEGAVGRFGIGVIANDIAKYFPDAVVNTGDRHLPDGTVVPNVLSVEAGDSGVTAALHHAVLQSLVEENASQQSEIEALKSSLEELKQMVEGLMNK